MFRLAAFLLLSGVVISSSMGATFYVDVDNIGGRSSDDNPGTINQPWNSVFKAFSSAMPGDTVIFRKGTYRQNWPISARHIAKGATAQSRITFRGYAGETTIITSMALSNDPAKWTLEQGSIYSTPLNYVQDLRYITSVSQDGAQLKLMTDVNENGGIDKLTGPGQWVRDVNERKVYVWSTLGGNPGNQRTEVGEMAFGGQGPISIYPYPAAAASQTGYITFDNLTFEGSGSPVAIGINGVEIKNCVFRNCSGSALVIGGYDLSQSDSNDPNVPFFAAQNGVVENCEFYSFGRGAIEIIGGDSWTLRGNKIHDNTVHAVNNASAIIINHADNAVVERNTIYKITTGNAIIDLDSSVCAQSRLYNAIIRNNIINDCTARQVVNFAAVNNCGFYNNLVHNTTISRAIVEFVAANDINGVLQASDAISIKNNIFYSNRSNLQQNRYQYYMNANSLKQFSSGYNVVESSFNYFVQDQAKTLAGFTALGGEIASITGIPLFKDAAKMDFHTVAGSCVIGKGCVLAGLVTDDFDGLSRSGIVDIGPFSCAIKNSAPVFTAISAKTVGVNKSILFTVRASDADGEALTYSVNNLPKGAKFTSGTFSWTPAASQVGLYYLTFSASDGKTTVSQVVRIVVVGAPILSPIGAKSGKENQAMTIVLSASDASGSVITYTATGLPAGAKMVGKTFTWTPSYIQAGTYKVTFQAASAVGTTSETVTITIANTDRMPVFSAIAAQSVRENAALKFVVTATDPDGSKVTYAAQGLPRGASFTGNTLNWKPDYTQAGTYNVTFTATADGVKTTKTVRITVINVK